MKGKYVLVAMLVFALDHLTKYIVSIAMHLGEGFEVIPGYFGITHARNFGVAFGLFNDHESAWQPFMLAGLAAIAVIVIYIYSSRMPPDRVFLQVSLAVTMGGILGNFADRIIRGSVVDFIEVHYRSAFHWPTFNIADSAITIGIAMLLIDTLRHPDPQVSSVESEPHA